MSGNKPWTVTSSAPYTGNYCSRSGSITHNQKSVMELTINVSAAGSISFARKVSCEVEYDFLRFSIDDQEIERWSGVQPWEEFIYPVTPGFHKFAWSYEKDGIGSAGQDRAWIDEISLPPHEIAVGTKLPENSGLQIGIAPNPTGGMAWLSLDLPDDQQVSVGIIDLLGRQIRTEQSAERLSAGRHVRQIDLSGMTPGVYLIEVRTPSGVQVEKVVKQ